MGTFSLPTTSTVRMNRDRTLTASGAKASPMRKAYLLRKRARKSGSPGSPPTSTSQPTRWARPAAGAGCGGRWSDAWCGCPPLQRPAGYPSWAHRFSRRSSSPRAVRVAVPADN